MNRTTWMVVLLSAALAFPAQAASVRYVHTDALGSVVAKTDENRVVLERREYEPYGRQLVPGNLQDGPGYTGHVQDAATQLTYMQQRYYDPLLGRFLSVDPITALSSPSGNFNRYRYANNNPYKFWDPDGRNSICPTQATCEVIESTSTTASPSTPADSGESQSPTSTSANTPPPDSVVNFDESEATNLSPVVVVAYRGEYHDELVRKLAEGMRAEGSTVLTEVKMCIGSVCARIDILARSPLGDLVALEVKTGLRPNFTPQQLAVYPHLRKGYILTAPDGKVRELGLVPGLTLPPIEGALLYQRDVTSPPFVAPFP